MPAKGIAMPHDKPKYLDGQPKERSGIYTIVAISWNKRFDPEQDSAVPVGYSPPPDAIQRIRDAERQHNAQLATRKRAPKVDKCINGTAFRQLPQGGWENIPGIHCGN